MVLTVDDVDTTETVHDEGPGIAQLSWLPAGSAPATQGRAVGPELLHPVITVFDDVQNVSLGAKSQVVRIRKLPRCFARIPPNSLPVARPV